MIAVVKGDKEGAAKWADTYQVPFPVYVDSDAVLYKRLGYVRSVSILKTENYSLYAGKIARNEAILPHHPGDDLFQMAGDITADSSGKLVYCWTMKTPLDRPSLDDLLTSIKSSSTS